MSQCFIRVIVQCIGDYLFTLSSGSTMVRPGGVNMSPTRFAAKLYRAHFMGRRVAVSGAARGLGQANARCFAESGASVFVIDRDDFVKEVVEEMRGKCFDAHAARAD